MGSFMFVVMIITLLMPPAGEIPGIVAVDVTK